MTQEEIQQKAYEVYPLDIDRHLIIEGEPYDNNRVKREAYIRGLTDSKPSLPSNLDEAEFEYAQSLDEIPANQEEEKMIYDAFKAGVEWMAGQGVKGYVIESFNPASEEGSRFMHGITLIYEDNEENYVVGGDKVIVQIRKK